VSGGAALDDVGRHARTAPDRLAAHDLATDRRFTYGALDLLIGRFAAQLAAQEIGLGDRVALLARNRIEHVVLHLACARLGAIFVPLNWRLSPVEIAAILSDASPRLLLGDASLAAAGLRGTPIEVFAAGAESLAPGRRHSVNSHMCSLLLYTSGTTGRPKGVMLSEGNLDETAHNFSELGAVTPDSIFLCDAPMFHVIGIVTNIRPALLQGAAFLVSDGFDPPRTLARLGDPALGVTHYFCVPQMAAALRADPAFDAARLRGLTAIFTGGAPLSGAAIQAWLSQGIAIVNGYGMSEAGTVFGMPVDRAVIAAHPGAVGHATARLQFRILDETGQVVAPGTPGELQLRGANVMQGYWRNPEETRAAFTADGWFRTGDIVRADPEGFHAVVGRRKDMFISGGENVYPAEIEALLCERSDIAECAVVGVPDARWGEVGHLVLVPAPGCQPDSAAILGHLEARLARFKLPRHVTMAASLPRNGAGKVLKAELRARLLSEAWP
jgi:fatty-acyl-CoA synthase